MSIDYSAPAEIYARRPRMEKGLFYRKFSSMAEALRFAIEDLPNGLTSVLLEAEDVRLEGATIWAMYEAADYPLPRVEAGQEAKAS